MRNPELDERQTDNVFNKVSRNANLIPGSYHFETMSKLFFHYFILRKHVYLTSLTVSNSISNSLVDQFDIDSINELFLYRLFDDENTMYSIDMCRVLYSMSYEVQFRHHTTGTKISALIESISK